MVRLRTIIIDKKEEVEFHDNEKNMGENDMYDYFALRQVIKVDENKLKSAIIAMNAIGSSRTEKWFLSKGLTLADLYYAVELDYLSKCDKDPSEFMSNTEYRLTQSGFDFAWKRD